MKPWQILVVGVLLGLIAGGIIGLMVSPPRGQPVRLSPLSTSGPAMVYVTGEVQAPGVYALEAGSRIQEAILKAGGFTQEAEQTAVNLASPIRDGLHVHVPAQGEPMATPPESQEETSYLRQPVDINSASLAELEVLPEIGSVKAQAIIEYREAHGGFTSPEQIQEVPGIGEGIYIAIRDLITVGSNLP